MSTKTLTTQMSNVELQFTDRIPLLYQIKPDKYEEKIFALSDTFLIIQPVGGSTQKNVKNDVTALLADIVSIKIIENKLSIGLSDEKDLSFVIPPKENDNGDEEFTKSTAYHILYRIMSYLQSHMPSIAVEDDLIVLDLPDDEWKSELKSSLLISRQPWDNEACGGFGLTYEYFRNALNLPCKDEIIWDIETIYSSRNSRRFVLSEFDHLDVKDFVPLLAAIGYSSFFRELDVSNVKLNSDCIHYIANAIKRNKYLRSLIMSHCGLKNDAICRLSSAMSFGSRIHHLDISNNPGLDDKVVINNLTAGIGRLGGSGAVVDDPGGIFDGSEWSGLHTFMISGCGFSLKSSNAIFTGISLSSLTKLHLDGNQLKNCQSLQTYLAQPNNLTDINLSHCDLTIETFCTSIQRGCTVNLENLDLSYNSFFSSTNQTQPPSSWKLFFANTIALKNVNLSESKLSVQVLEELFDGFSDNTNLPSSSIYLDLSGNDLKGQGAISIGQKLKVVTVLKELNISNNNMTHNLTSVIKALHGNTTLKSLLIGNNMAGLKATHISVLMTQLADLIEDDDSSLESLSLADSRLRSYLSILINGLANGSASLRHLDISGNAMGDIGGRILARVLSVTTGLTSLNWDRNGLSLPIIQEVIQSLEMNTSMKDLALPWNDLAACGAKADKILPIITKNVSVKLNELRDDINSPKLSEDVNRPNSAQVFQIKLVQKHLDEQSTLLETKCCSLEGRYPPNANETEEARIALHRTIAKVRQVVANARHARGVIAGLQREGQDPAADSKNFKKMVDTVRERLDRMADELKTVIEREMDSELTHLVDAAYLTHQTQSSTESGAAEDEKLLAAESWKEETRQTCLEYTRLQENSLNKLLDDTLKKALQDKMASMHKEMVAHLSDRIHDTILHSLVTAEAELKAAVTTVIAHKPVPKLPPSPSPAASLKSRPNSQIEGGTSETENDNSAIILRSLSTKDPNSAKKHCSLTPTVSPRRRPKSSALNFDNELTPAFDLDAEDLDTEKPRNSSKSENDEKSAIPSRTHESSTDSLDSSKDRRSDSPNVSASPPRLSSTESLDRISPPDGDWVVVKPSLDPKEDKKPAPSPSEVSEHSPAAPETAKADTVTQKSESVSELPDLSQLPPITEDNSKPKEKPSRPKNPPSIKVEKSNKPTVIKSAKKAPAPQPKKDKNSTVTDGLAVAAFDSVSPSTALSHPAKARPKRAKMHAPTAPVVGVPGSVAEVEIGGEVTETPPPDQGIQSFFESSATPGDPLTHQSPQKPPKPGSPKPGLFRKGSKDVPEKPEKPKEKTSLFSKMFKSAKPTETSESSKSSSDAPSPPAKPELPPTVAEQEPRKGGDEDGDTEETQQIKPPPRPPMMGVAMPGLGGVDLAAQLKSRPQLRHSPVATGDAAAELRSSPHGADSMADKRMSVRDRASFISTGTPPVAPPKPSKLTKNENSIEEEK